MNRRTTTRPQTAASKAAVGRRSGPITPRNTGNCKSKQVVSANVLFVILILVIAGIYGLVIYAFYEVEVTPGENQPGDKQSPHKMEAERRMGLRGQPVDTPKTLESNKYPYWRDLAVRLAAMPAGDLLKELQEKDPFGTRRFEEALLEQETNLGRLLEHSELEALFPCPASRITVPDQRNLQKAKDFRDNKPGTFLFFQHLRKGRKE